MSVSANLADTQLFLGGDLGPNDTKLDMPSNVLYSLLGLCNTINRSSGPLPGQNMLERWDYFRKGSESGENCPYALKARSLFMKHDYQKVKEALVGAVRNLRIVEGEQFARD